MRSQEDPTVVELIVLGIYLGTVALGLVALGIFGDPDSPNTLDWIVPIMAWPAFVLFYVILGPFWLAYQLGCLVRKHHAGGPERG